MLLEEQDRATWDRARIALGLEWLAKSAEGEVFSRYHAEAGIAAEHCLAPSFEHTRWARVVACYELLEKVAPSPIHRLNRAVALAQWKGPQTGLDVLREFELPRWLANSYLCSAVLADLYRRGGWVEKAQQYARAALDRAPNAAVRALLERRLGTPAPNPAHRAR